MSTKFGPLIAAVGIALSLPATARPWPGTFATSPEVCELQFRLADGNRDGVLQGEEVNDVWGLIAASRDGAAPITHQQFLGACLEAFSRQRT